MEIELQPDAAYPFGPNIHFAYQVDTAELLYLHADFNWVIEPQEGLELRELLASKIHHEDLIELKTTFYKAVSGLFNGSVKIKLSTPLRYRWLQVCPFIARQLESGILFGNITEITDEIANNEIIARYANKKNSILHMLAHDLRGPLNIAKSVTKLIDGEMGKPELHQKTQYIAGILQQAINLIADLVNREFLETTEVVLVKKKVDIVCKLNEYLEECRRSEDLAERSFILLRSHEEIFIELDDAKFMQIVNNLVSNALKFTAPSGEIIVKVIDAGDEVKFSFSDNGIGIPKAHIEEVFDEFTAARRPGLNGEPTLGLGLSIVKTIVGWHGGTIWCDSEEGSGTTFHFTLPKSG
ncbi:HAMP domain-containing sensor histidine kinase [Pedobacter antarcticus]|uniref:sensor histidine kinase n=1 Tax=Pedobacter antarcticus TaxID=34086 RepID=UPI00292E70C9|nr:HAMP domain-containing sensor histidine kinase [Pedobacter antarcticus]